MRKLYLLLVLLLTVSLAHAAPAAKVTLGDRSFTIVTPRLQATFQDGMIVALKDLRSGEVHADAATGEVRMPSGLGHLTGDAKAMETLHSPWGNQQMNQDLPPGQAFPTMHRPGRRHRRGGRSAAAG